MWTCNFETEEYIALKQMSIGAVREEMANSILLGIPRSRYDPELFEKIIANSRGQVMEHADEAWQGRYLPLRIKKLGPSIVVGEVLVPVRRLDGFLEALYKKLKNETFGIEGTITSRREAAVRLFVLSDERESFGLNYLGEWSHPINMLKVAKKFSGRTYQTGLFLGMETKNYFGTDRLKWIYSFKRVVDPNGILNPGKIVPMYRYALIFGMASHFLGLMKSKRYKQINPPDKEIAYLTDYYAHIQSCIACGYCRNNCPVYNEVKWESSSSKDRPVLQGRRPQLPQARHRPLHRQEDLSVHPLRPVQGGMPGRIAHLRHLDQLAVQVDADGLRAQRGISHHGR